MHVLIAFLGSLVTVLWLLHRLAEMGVTLGGLNPWAWARRRRWKKMYEGNPMFRLTDPMEVAGLLAVAVAKVDGDMSSEEKREILALFERVFHLTEKQASDLMVACVHLLQDGQELRANVKKLLATDRVRFTPEQVDLMVSMLDQVAGLGSGASNRQRELVAEVRGCLKGAAPAPSWGT